MNEIPHPGGETAPHAPDRASGWPLVVSLDKTLVRTDLLLESIFRCLGNSPWRTASLLRALSQGRAQAKALIAREKPIDAASLPYNSQILSLIRHAREAGRPVYLASASNQRQVDEIAKHLGLFDGWVASDETCNLTGKTRADLLVERFGGRGFDYVGNGRADLPVWAVAGNRIAVGAPEPVIAALKQIDSSARVIRLQDGDQDGDLLNWLRLIRVHQWSKNALIFIPAFSAHRFDVASIAQAFVAAVSFSLAASSIYILNDLVDLESDRRHRTKRFRPLAAGQLSLGKAIVASWLLLLLSFAVGLLLTPMFLAVLAAYLALTTAYSFHLKRKMMVDIVTLASLYTLRILAGAAAVSAVPSEWILAFSMFIFTALALIKRYVELAAKLDAALPDPANRNYRKTDLNTIGALAAASGFNAVTVFALYISSDTVHRLYRHPKALWLICPILLYWVGRALILADRRLMDDDPIAFALKDRVSFLSLALIAVIMIAAAA
jgi:4-hydroxybenzoate polyprenyltransferase/phosphoserine phosphatase